MDAADKSNIDLARERLLSELPDLVEQYIDTARTEGTTQAYDRLMGFALKAIEGLQVNAKPDPYANMPVIHVSFGSNMQMVTTVEAAPEETPVPVLPNIVDAVAKLPAPAAQEAPLQALPDDPLELLDAPPPASAEEQAVLDALAGSLTAMAFDD